MISLAWLFGEGLKFVGLSVGAAALGSYVGVELYNKHKQSNTAFDFSPQVGTYGEYNPDPDDDANNIKERVFNTVSKTEFFKKVEEHYEYYKNGIYKKKMEVKELKTQNIFNGIIFMEMLKHNRESFYFFIYASSLSSFKKN